MSTTFKHTCKSKNVLQLHTQSIALQQAHINQHFEKHTHVRGKHTLSDASVCAAEATSLLPVTVEPHAENHEDQPAGGTNASNKGRLPHHIWDLRQCVSLLTDVHHLACRVWSAKEKQKFDVFKCMETIAVEEMGNLSFQCVENVDEAENLNLNS